jgi:hypothetical protein
VEISDGAVIKCNYELCAEVVNKPNIQSKNPVESHSNKRQYFQYKDLLCRWITTVISGTQEEKIKEETRAEPMGRHKKNDKDDKA